MLTKGLFTWLAALYARHKRLLLALAGIPLLWILLNVLFPLHVSVEYAPLITDRKGELLFTRLTTDEKWRLRLQAAEITPLMEKAILAKEDRWFYYHPGVNPFSAGRALFRNIFSGRRTSGASTITMQVARLLQPGKRTYLNKIKEMFRATQLEWKYSKKEILRLYLNLAPYGGNMEGLASASWFYLNKSPDHLSLAEIVALSVIPNRPNSLRPGMHNEKITEERNRWLRWMAENGFFGPKDIADALREPFTAVRRSAPRLAPHLSLKLLANRTEDHTETFISMQVQATAEKIVADYMRSLSLQGIKNAAVIVVHNPTREVLAYCGSADFYDTTDGGQVNGARAWRQPGSTLKPLVYGLAIDAGLVTPQKVISDVPVNYGGYVPENYDLTYQGQVSMEYALMHSLNIPAVNMLQQVGQKKLLQSLVSCGFEQIKRDENKLGLSMVLGGCGTSLEELTGLYCMLADNGLYKPLRFAKSSPLKPAVRILSEEACFMLHETLSKIDRPDLPLNWATTESLPRIAWKTGTSYGRRDAWSIGYNKTFTIGVWTGNFSGAANAALSGATIATPLLFRLFNAIDRQSHTDWFGLPKGIDRRMVCTETGMPAAPECNQRVLDYFIPLVSAPAMCNHLAEIMVSPDGTTSYCVECAPAGGYKKQLFTRYPPEVQAFRQSLGQEPGIPPHNTACITVWREKGPVIQSPQHDATYMISRQHPEPLLLECRAEADVAMVHWYINNKHYKTSAARDKVYCMPPAGAVKISCTDDKGRNRDIRIMVEMVEF